MDELRRKDVSALKDVLRVDHLSLRGHRSIRGAAELANTKWHFPHAVDALEGKHWYHSIVHIAVVDADYEFQWVNDGSPGSCTDAQNLNDCKITSSPNKSVGNRPDPLPHDNTDSPFSIIAAETFALKPSGTFGILPNRFGCLLTMSKQNPSTVESIVLACVCLHTIMRVRYAHENNCLLDVEDENHQIIPGTFRQGATSDWRQLNNRAAKEQRLLLKHNSSSPAGSVVLQDRMV
ncbi:hypothetical protein MAR_006544 [Mya arenaria]|uniref:Nuclease HARBI1 n=1 Tax=Mya arenaria TaxID=6604 RepID=A0ABY7DAZ1_MYAAR|nr:hypothetical protein MAR_006544 [Mya arenaria]